MGGSLITRDLADASRSCAKPSSFYSPEFGVDPFVVVGVPPLPVRPGIDRFRPKKLSADSTDSYTCDSNNLTFQNSHGNLETWNPPANPALISRRDMGTSEVWTISGSLVGGFQNSVPPCKISWKLPCTDAVPAAPSEVSA